MAVTITRVTQDGELHEIAQLAEKIWQECFPGIISEEQIGYMVDKFQSYEAMRAQVDTQNYTYFAVRDDSDLCGYIGAKPEEDERYFLSKLYLCSDKRGSGIASQMLQTVFREARSNGKKRVYLTVNKHNRHAIEVYKAKGFVVADTAVTDIGEGFVMDDFIMEYAF